MIKEKIRYIIGFFILIILVLVWWVKDELNVWEDEYYEVKRE